MTRDTHDAHAGSPLASELVEELVRRLRATAEDVVPWFLQTMPRRYLQDTDDATRLGHLSAILAARTSSAPMRLVLKSADESEWTMIHDRDYPGLLAELLAQLPDNRSLRSAKVHTSADGAMVLDVFRFADTEIAPMYFSERDPDYQQVHEQIADAARAAGTALRSGDSSALTLEEFLTACPAYYVRTVAPSRLVDAWGLCRSMFGTDDSAAMLALEDADSPKTWRISVAAGNAPVNATFSQIAAQLGHADLNIVRAYLDRFESKSRGSVLLLSYVVASNTWHIDPDSERWRYLKRDILRVRWMDDRIIALARKHPRLGLDRAEIMVALAHLAHASLISKNPHAYAVERIHALCERHIDCAMMIVDLFRRFFDPAQHIHPADSDPASPADDAPSDDLWSDQLGQEVKAIYLRIEREVDDPDAKQVLAWLLLAIQSTLATNAFIDNRYALAIRFDPDHLQYPKEGDDQPFGVFYVHGRGFSGYHVRFRDIARGGLRVVPTAGPQQHALELERLYGEAYGLAFAQQLKNKDIPEGGAKAVVLAAPSARVDDCVKAFVDSLLDLLVHHGPEDAPALPASPVLIDRRPHPERLYLGPDENISPALIEWVVERAHRRGYNTPEAFMSSKPGAGINHKEYGVTSEGVTVFLEEALRARGIDPRKQPFTVKLTGGPDGDVAGNEMKILDREFGDHARIVGIADGSGSAEDPDGLDHGELLRLFALGLPIAHFDSERLGPSGQVVPISAANGIELRNSLHNRVRADAFIPAGGRPATIHSGNWRSFIQDGQPSSPIIVEGANLFLTPEAREALSSQAGVIIIKDSSANKCGVICSSFEILASMLLPPETLVDIKPRFVAEVLERLRDLARREARLLFRERRHDPEAQLHQLSVRLSRVILRATNAIEGTLAELDQTDETLLSALIDEHVPAVLREHARDRLRSDIPPSYWTGMVAAVWATKIVYREGLHYLDRLDEEALGTLALSYLRQEREIVELVAEVADSGLPAKARIAALLRAGGTRAALDLGSDVGMESGGDVEIDP